MLYDTLKKIKLQLKFGRVVEAEESLLALLEANFTEERARILPLFVDLNFQTGYFEEAAKSITECLQLEISEELKSELKKKLTICEERIFIVPSEPDLNAPELTSFLDSMENFLTGKPRSKHQFIELNDPEEVRRCAHDQNIPPPYYSWNGARTLASRQTMNYVYKHKLIMDAFNKECRDRIFKLCEKLFLDGRPSTQYFYDIYADLSLIARGLVIKQSNQLLEKMKVAYEMSLFPCGWKGEFPEGELVVYKLW